MGTDFRSLAVKGANLEDVRGVLVEWMGRRGFEIDDQPLFPCEGDDERGAFLLTSEDWVVVCFSEAEEERRLTVELDAVHAPILGLWCHDSDIWGYTLVVDEEVRADFFSKSSSFEPTNYFGDSADDSIYDGDAETIARVLGVPDRAARLAKIQKKWRLMRESVALEFYETLDLAGAATTYAYLESGESVSEGWTVERLRFARPSAGATFDLHSDALWQRLPNDSAAMRDGPTLKIPRSWRLLAWCFSLLLRPVLWVAVLAMRRQLSTERLAPAESNTPCPYRLEGQHVVNDTRGVRVRLPDGAAIGPWTSMVDPWTALAVEAQEGLIVCMPMRNEAVRQAGRHFDSTDESFFVGELKARRLVRTTATHGRGEPRIVTTERYFVQTAAAVYRIGFVEPRMPVPSPALRTVVDSFETIGRSQAAPSST